MIDLKAGIRSVCFAIIGLSMLMVLSGCRTAKRVEKMEAASIQYLNNIKDSIDIRTWYDGISTRKIYLKHIDWSRTDTTGRQYPNAVTCMTVEEKRDDKGGMELIAGSEADEKYDEDRYLSVENKEERKNGWGLSTYIIIIGLTGGIIFIIVRLKGKMQ